MDSTSHLIHVAPADQPVSVHQIAQKLLPAYTVDAGHVHLAGCTLEDRPFVRLEFVRGGKTKECFVDEDGQEVEQKLVEALGMTQVAELARPPQTFDPQVERLIDMAAQTAAERFAPGTPPELVTATALWCKFAEGKLRFTVGEESADLPFAGWSRTLRPPPFVCPYTGRSTFHLAATDDGRIAAADQIEACAETGLRVLADELVTCSVTGRRVLAELIETCPVSGRRLLAEEMVACPTCRERVSPAATEQNQCAACRGLQRVSKADPRMARVLDEHRPLDRWRNWRISETASVYILTAARWFRRLLVVADKDSLEIKLLATGARIFGGWNVVEPGRYDYVLRG